MGQAAFRCLQRPRLTAPLQDCSLLASGGLEYLPLPLEYHRGGGELILARPLNAFLTVQKAMSKIIVSSVVRDAACCDRTRPASRCNMPGRLEAR